MGVDFRTQAIHAGYEPLDNGRAAVPPILPRPHSTRVTRRAAMRLAGGDIDGFEYSHVANPSTAIIDIEPLAERPDSAIYCTSAGHQR